MAGWLEEAVCGCVGLVPDKSHNKPIGHLLMAFLPPPPSLSTGQYTEEGHCSAYSGEERAAGGAESEERRYCDTTSTPYRSFVLLSLPQITTNTIHTNGALLFFFGEGHLTQTQAHLGPHAT